MVSGGGIGLCWRSDTRKRVIRHRVGFIAFLPKVNITLTRYLLQPMQAAIDAQNFIESVFFHEVSSFHKGRVAIAPKICA